MKRLLFVLLFTTISINAKTLPTQYTTNFTHNTNNTTANGIFAKVCLEGVLYWLYSSSIKNNIIQEEGGLTPYINKKTLSYQRCKIISDKCIITKNKLGQLTSNSKNLCFKKFIEIP